MSSLKKDFDYVTSKTATISVRCVTHCIVR